MSEILPNQPRPPQQENSSGNGTSPAQPRQVRVSFQPRDKRPLVSWILLGVTVFIYILQVLSENLFGTDLLLLYGAKINELIYQGQVWRLITPMFLHGSLMHIAFNMYALYVIGPGLELYYGHLRFLVLYLVAGFAGNVLSLVFTSSASLGASTAIFGLIAAQGIFIYRNKLLFGKRTKSMLTNIVMIVVVNLILGLQPGIDNWGHLGGLLGGALFAWFSGPEFAIKQESWGLALENKRTNDETWRTLILTAVLFSAIALVKIMLFQ
ncbi:MAG: rhomboid family intramembrane serine protease [Chloroflexi bacterium]|nr:rhomboid family intramembrane serine protease [Chloroflexota bacterium]